MSFSDLYVTRRTRKNHPLLAMEKLIDWVALDRVIHRDLCKNHPESRHHKIF